MKHCAQRSSKNSVIEYLCAPTSTLDEICSLVLHQHEELLAKKFCEAHSVRKLSHCKIPQPKKRLRKQNYKEEC